ncbi:MAG TPA: alpha/beta hydrolase [Terracidiphilus sp.]|nr:alpha/beta hydrolase [Terracidiphilus sp.]
MERRHETQSFHEFGTGQPVVFLHPTPLDHRYWLPVAERLTGIRAILVDLRGHGRSELGECLPVGGFVRVPDAPVLEMSQYAADVLGILDALEIERAVFAGCSIGGYVMMDLWRRAPGRMGGIALVCSKPQPDAEANLAKRAENIAKVRREGTAGFFDGSAQSLVSASARAKRPETVKEVRAFMTPTVEGVVAVQAGLGTRPDSVPTVATITVPVLAIAGGEDPTTSPAEMEAYKAAPGGCEFHALMDGGHFAAYEQPERVAGWLGEWLKQFAA